MYLHIKHFCNIFIGGLVEFKTSVALLLYQASHGASEKKYSQIQFIKPRYIQNLKNLANEVITKRVEFRQYRSVDRLPSFE